MFSLCSISLLFPLNSSEYSIGLSDKLSYFGPISKSWIKEKDNKESYFVIGGMGLMGGVGYGQKYYFSKGVFSPYFSLTGFGCYVLAIRASSYLGISGTLGFDVNVIEWKKKKIILQFGIISMYDLLRNENLTIGAENGPSFLMPSFNIKLNYIK